MNSQTPRIFSVGHSNRSLESLIGLLSDLGVSTLVDVRARPASRRFPWLDRRRLEPAISEAGMGYLWEGADLGGLRPPRAQDRRHCGLAEPPFRAYARHMGTARFRAALRRLVDAAALAPTAMMCAERDPERCHRSLIADRLVMQGCAVEHIVRPGESRLHRVHPALRLEGEIPLYDRLGQAEFDF